MMIHSRNLRWMVYGTYTKIIFFEPQEWTKVKENWVKFHDSLQKYKKIWKFKFAIPFKDIICIQEHFVRINSALNASDIHAKHGQYKMWQVCSSYMPYLVMRAIK